MNRLSRFLLRPLLCVHHFYAYSLLHIELNGGLEVGEGLRIFHGYCLVIHPQTRIGKNVTLRHCVTLGNKGGTGGAPVLLDEVDVGAHAIIIGPITVGANSVIGAGAVVTKDVPPGAVMVGNPARILRFSLHAGEQRPEA